MKLTILGGSAAGGNTGAGCSGYLLNSGESNVVLDLGPGVLPELRKHADFRTLEGIVISHLHLDHTLDLGALRFALAYNPNPPAQPIPLWMPPGGRAFLDAFSTAFRDEPDENDFFTSVFDIAEYDPSGSISVGDVSITFRKTIHYIPCWAMRVHTPGSPDLLYTADTGPASKLVDFGEGCQVVVAESGTLDGEGESFEERGHLTPQEAGTLAESIGAKTLVLTHLWEEYDFDVYRERAASAFEGELMIAAPGVSMEF